MSVIGEALIEVRPDTTKFTNGIRESLTSAAKFAAGAFALGGAFEFAKGAVEAAAQAQEAQVRLANALRNTGNASAEAAAQTQVFLTKLRDTAGFAKADLADALTRAVTGSGSLAKGMQLVSLATEVARGRNIGLTQALQVLLRVNAGSVGSLRRIGIAFTAATPAADALKGQVQQLQQEQQKLTRESTRLSQASAGETKAEKAATTQKRNRLAIEKQDLAAEIARVKQTGATTKALDKQTSVTQALALVQERFKGSVKDFSQTASGQLALLQNEFKSLQVQIGTALLPLVVKGAAEVGVFIHWLSTLGPEAHTVVNDLQPLAQVLVDIGHALGPGPIITFLAVFKGLQVVVGLASAVQARYAAALEAAAKAQADEAKSAAAAAAALQAKAAAAAEAAAADTAVAGESEAAAASMGGAEAATVGFGDALAGMVNPVTLAVAGVAALAAGAYYLSTQQSAVSLATQHVTSSLAGYASAMNAAQSAQEALKSGADGIALSQARLGVAEADLAVKQARADLNNKALNQTSLERRRNDLSLREALLQQTQAEGALGDAIGTHASHVDAAQKAQDAYYKSIGNVNTQIDNLRKTQQAQAEAEAATSRGALNGKAALGVLGSGSAKVADQTQQVIAKLEKIKIDTDKLPPATAAMVRHNVTVLQQYIRKTGEIPTHRQTTLILENKDAEKSAQDFLYQFGVVIDQAKTLATDGGTAIGENLGTGVAAGLIGAQTHLNAVADTTVHQTVLQMQKAAQQNSPSKLTRDQVGKPLGEGIAVGILLSANGINAAVKQTLQGAVDSAKQNLGSLAGGLSSTIGTFLDQQLATSPEGKALASAQAQQNALDLQQQISDAQAAVTAAKAGTQERAKAEADLAVLIAQKNYDAQQARVDAEKNATQQTLADLSDALNRRLITQKQYNEKVAALLKGEGVTYKAAGQSLGLAFADGFLAQLTDLFKQAQLITKAGLPGSGLGSQLQDPLSALRDQLKQARQDLAQAKKAATDASGPGGKSVTASEAKQLARDKRLAMLLAEALRSAERIHIENLNVNGAAGDSGTQVAEEILAELGLVLA